MTKINPRGAWAVFTPPTAAHHLNPTCGHFVIDTEDRVPLYINAEPSRRLARARKLVEDDVEDAQLEAHRAFGPGRRHLPSLGACRGRWRPSRPRVCRPRGEPGDGGPRSRQARGVGISRPTTPKAQGPSRASGRGRVHRNALSPSYSSRPAFWPSLRLA